MKKAFDVAIVGAGFSGSLLAMILRRLGRSVILLERGRHPRFVIGESSTPLANLLLEHLAEVYDLPAIAPFSKWGSWRRAYPQIPVGLKRGFTFYRHDLGQPFQPDPDHANEMMVAASPNNRLADTHWYRPEFDRFLAEQAAKMGVEYLDQTELLGVETRPAGMVLRARPEGGRARTIHARFLVDASGPRGFLHRALQLPEKPFESFPKTEGLYTHFRRVGPFVACAQTSDPPYPAEQAAVHHIFPGGWIWVLHFNHGITSAGVAATAPVANELRLSEGPAAWARLMEKLPSLEHCFRKAEPVERFVHAPRLPFRCGVTHGDRWVLLPSAAGVIDPLLSTGIPLTLLGVARLAQVMAEDWRGKRFGDNLNQMSRRCEEELAFTARLVAALYATFGVFQLFKKLVLLYFAALSFTEASIRLGRREVTGSFLTPEEPGARAQWEACLTRSMAIGAQGESAGRIRKRTEEIIRLIDPINIAGFGRPAKKDWYGVDFCDLFAGADKLGVSTEAIQGMLDRLGLQGAGEFSTCRGEPAG